MTEKVALITGAARPWGLGRATAMKLARAGYDIAIADIREDWGAEALATIPRETGRRAFFVRTELTDEASIRASVKAVEAEFGRIDALCNIAGIHTPMKKLDEFTAEEVEHMMAINFKAPLFMCQSVIPVMKRQGGGRIVNVSSGSSVQPVPNLAVYAASKAALEQLSRVLAWEVARHKIIVTIVAPGTMVTAMGSEGGPADTSFGAENRYTPHRRSLHPDEVADCIAYAVTNGHIALTGQRLMADGGTYMT